MMYKEITEEKKAELNKVRQLKQQAINQLKNLEAREFQLLGSLEVLEQLGDREAERKKKKE